MHTTRWGGGARPGCTKLTTGLDKDDEGTHGGAQGSASMLFSSSLSFLTNSCASLLVRPSNILSADFTAGRGRVGWGAVSPYLQPALFPHPGPALTLGSGPAQVQGDRLPGSRAPSHLRPCYATNAAQAEGRLPREVVGGQPVVVHDREQHAGAPAAARLCRHRAAGGGRSSEPAGLAREDCWGRGGTLTSRRARRTRGAASGS